MQQLGLTWELQEFMFPARVLVGGRHGNDFDFIYS